MMALAAATFLVRRIHNGVAFLIHAFHQGRRVALQADLVSSWPAPRSASGRGSVTSANRLYDNRSDGSCVTPLAVDPAHVAGGAGGNEHVLASSSVSGGAFRFSQVLLGGEHDTVLGLGVNFHLRMIGTEVALPAGAGQARDRHRRGVPRVAVGAVADGAVGVRFANRNGTRCSRSWSRTPPSSLRQRMRRTFHRAGMQFFHLADHRSGEKSLLPATATQDGAACRLRTNWS